MRSSNRWAAAVIAAAMVWCVLAPGRGAASAPAVLTNGPYEGVVDVPLRVEATTEITTISGVYWQFGDGSSDRGLTAWKTFEAPGVYDVTVTVKDERGEAYTARTTATIVAFHR